MKRRIRKKPLQKHPPMVEVHEPNDLWTIDFKGWWHTGDGERAYPLTVRDQFSRFVLAVDIKDNQAMPGVQETLLDLFRRFGLPKAIQSDNGPPFGCTRARGGLTRLSAWLISYGIRVVFSRPGHPQDNGGHERMHLDLRYEVEDNASATLADEQDAAIRWRHAFNEHRPHEALRQKTPADVYTPSTRRLLGAVKLPVYPASWTTRMVGGPGRISVRGNLYHVGAGLIGHKLGLEPLGDSRVRLWLYEYDLGELDLTIVTQRRPAQRGRWAPRTSK